MTKPWYASYEPGIPTDISPLAYTSLAHFCEQICEQFPDKTAFSNFGSSITYQQFGEYTRALACFLREELKLTQGARVAIMMPNLLQYPVAIFGIMRAGLIAVNINPQYTKPELLHQLQDCGAEVVIAWDGSAKVLEAAMAEMENPPRVIITHLGDLMPGIKKCIFQIVLKYIKKQIHPWKISNAYYFNDAIAKGKTLVLPTINIGLNDVAFLQYTGGTTGVSKGAMLTHSNLLSNLMQAVEWIKNDMRPGEDHIAISPLPFYHIFALTANCLLFMYLGGHDVLITNPRDIPHLIKTMKQYRFTFITGVNTLFNAILNNPQIAEVDFNRLIIALSGGMAVQIAVAQRWQKTTGKVLLEGYGLTETSPAVTITPTHVKAYTPGLPIPSTDIQIRDENGNALGLNQSGELCVKGPQVMLGYWHQPEETAQVLDNEGWLRTGDIAMIDDQGYVHLLDRKKDMILVSGFNVYPNELEDVVAKCSGVLEVAAVGVPDEHSGEAVKLYIVKKDASLQESNIMSCCHENLTGYKRPKYIEFRTELPKTNVGKILRRALRDENKTS